MEANREAAEELIARARNALAADDDADGATDGAPRMKAGGAAETWEEEARRRRAIRGTP